MSWISLRITPGSNRDGVIAALFESGSQGVQEDGVAVVTHFPAGAPISEIRSAVMAADPRADIAIANSPDTDYSQWRASVSSHRVGGLVIAPPWLARGLDPDTTVIVDPVMAFGTGEHATTRGAMRLMQGVIRARDVVADLGAGSAVLAIAAVKLGAATILPLLAPVRVVIANIVSSVIIPMLPLMRASLATGGQAILAGILADERAAMGAALEAGGWAVEREDTEEVWWSVQIAPR